MPKPLFITDHARKAMMQRRVSMDDILKIISDYETMDKNRNGISRFFKQDLCVVLQDDPKKYIVKTVLYRFGNQWTDEDVRKRHSR